MLYKHTDIEVPSKSVNLKMQYFELNLEFLVSETSTTTPKVTQLTFFEIDFLHLPKRCVYNLIEIT